MITLKGIITNLTEMVFSVCLILLEVSARYPICMFPIDLTDNMTVRNLITTKRGE